MSGWLDSYFVQLDPHEQLAEVRLEHLAVTGNVEVLVTEFGLRSRKHHFEGSNDTDAEIEISEVFARASD